MKKVILFLTVASLAFVVGMLLMAPEPSKASAAVSVSVPAVPALDSPPAVITVGTVLIVADPVEEAPKPRPAPARPRPAKAKTWSCGEPKAVGEAGRLSQRPVDGPTVRTCGWI